jgi:hypothetical protein
MSASAWNEQYASRETRNSAVCMEKAISGDLLDRTIHQTLRVFFWFLGFQAYIYIYSIVKIDHMCALEFLMLVGEQYFWLLENDACKGKVTENLSWRKP